MNKSTELYKRDMHVSSFPISFIMANAILQTFQSLLQFAIFVNGEFIFWPWCIIIFLDTPRLGTSLLTVYSRQKRFLKMEKWDKCLGFHHSLLYCSWWVHCTVWIKNNHGHSIHSITIFLPKKGNSYIVHCNRTNICATNYQRVEYECMPIIIISIVIELI